MVSKTQYFEKIQSVNKHVWVQAIIEVANNPGFNF